jgi:hypothetical protein
LTVDFVDYSRIAEAVRYYGKLLGYQRVVATVEEPLEDFVDGQRYLAVHHHEGIIQLILMIANPPDRDQAIQQVISHVFRCHHYLGLEIQPYAGSDCTNLEEVSTGILMGTLRVLDGSPTLVGGVGLEEPTFTLAREQVLRAEFRGEERERAIGTDFCKAKLIKSSTTE